MSFSTSIVLITFATPIALRRLTDTNSLQIVHVAAPLLDNPAHTDYDRDFLQPSVAGNRALLQSAHKHAPTVKSIVVTGSVNASTTGSPDELNAGPLTDKTWLPITQEQARAQNNPYISYCSGKKEGELAIWEFVKSASPKYSVTVLLPALIFGPPIHAVKNGVKGLNYSCNVVYGLFNGSSEEVPATTFPSYIDVRDLADAHVRALTEAKVANKRLNIGGLDMTYSDMVRAMAKLPEVQGRLPRESGEDKKVVKARIVADEANGALKMKYRSLEETMADTVKRLLVLEKEA